MTQGTTVYRFFDAEDRLIYLGVASHFPRRFHEHEIVTRWMGVCVRATMTHYGTREEALDAERDGIIVERPVFNIVYNRAKKARIRSSRESRPPKVGPDRRKYGTGSIFQRSDGVWAAHLPTGKRDGRRTHRWFYGKTEETVRAKLDAALADPDRWVPWVKGWAQRASRP